MTHPLPPLKRGKATTCRYMLTGRSREEFFCYVLPELVQFVFYYEVVVFSVSVIGDTGGIGRLLHSRVIVEGDGDNGTGAFHQAGGIETDVAVVLHILHAGMATFGYPPVKKQSFGVCGSYFGYSAGIEAQLVGFVLYLGGQVRHDRLFKPLKRISFLLQPFAGAGPGFAHVRFGFEGVVEDDDGAVAGIVLYHIKDTVRGHMGTVIAGDDIPHDDLVLPS